MAEIKASDVQKLRQMTGAGMMDCKNALSEAGGDFDRAQEIIREKGKLVAAKRADRETKEGTVEAHVTQDGKTGVLLCIGCETDFVAKNDEFKKFAQKVNDVALSKLPENLQALMTLSVEGNTVEGLLTEQTGKTGEKHQIPFYGKLQGEMLAGYNHGNGKVATLVAFSKVIDATAARNIAMQIAAMNPVSISSEDCPAELRENELKIGREQAKLDGKPENMIEKIAEGKLQKFFKESTLLSQTYIKAEKNETVADYLKSVDASVKVTAFYRFSLND